MTIGRAGAWSTLTSEALLSTSITEVSAAHAQIIARNVDLARMTKIENGTPHALSIDEALVTVAAECACDVSDLWVFGCAGRGRGTGVPETLLMATKLGQVPVRVAGERLTPHKTP